MQHIDHISKGRHRYHYVVDIKGRGVEPFGVFVEAENANQADRDLDGILKAQEIPFACATLEGSTDPRARHESRAVHRSDELDKA